MTQSSSPTQKMTRERLGYSIAFFSSFAMMAAKSARMNKLFAMQERSSSRKQEQLDANYPTDPTQIRAWLSQNTYDRLDQISVPLLTNDTLPVPNPVLLEASIATLQICQEHWEDQEDPEQQEGFRGLIRRLDRILEYLEAFGMLFWDYRDREEEDPIFAEVQAQANLRDEGFPIQVLQAIAKVAAIRPELAHYLTKEPQPIVSVASDAFRSCAQLAETNDEDGAFFLEAVVQRAIRLVTSDALPIAAMAAAAVRATGVSTRRKIRPDAKCGHLIARM